MSVLFAATYPERCRALVVYGSLPRFTRAPGFPYGMTREEAERDNAEDERALGHRRAGALVPRQRRGGRGGRGLRALACDRARARGPLRQLNVMNLRDRRARRAPVRPGAHARAASRRRPRPDRRSSLDGRADPGRAVRRAARRPAHGLRRRLASASPPRSSVSSSRSARGRSRSPFRTACSRRSSSRTSSARPRARPSSEIAAGWSCSSGTTPPSASSLRGSAERSSTRPATASSPASTGRRARSGAPRAIGEAVEGIGLEVRAGLHTGECEIVDGKVAGIAVSIGARVAAQAERGRDPRLADGQGPRRGLGHLRSATAVPRELKGVPGRVAPIRGRERLARRGSGRPRRRRARGSPGRSASRSRRTGGGAGSQSRRRARSAGRRTR